MVALSIGGFSRILVDLVDLPVDFSVDFLVLVSQGCLSVGFNLSVGLDRVDTAISPFSNICCQIYRLSIAIVARLQCNRNLCDLTCNLDRLSPRLQIIFLRLRSSFRVAQGPVPPWLALPVDLLSYETSQCPQSWPHCNGYASSWLDLPVDLQSSTWTYHDSYASSIHIRVSYWLRFAYWLLSTSRSFITTLLGLAVIDAFVVVSSWCLGVALSIVASPTWIDHRHSMRTRLHRPYTILTSSYAAPNRRVIQWHSASEKVVKLINLQSCERNVSDFLKTENSVKVHTPERANEWE
jgi:hypothetical protein